MGIPTHKFDCYTKTYITKCQYCNSKVFFMSCNCGSKVFFDELGWPWRLHFCKNLAIKEAIEMIRDFERYTDEEIYKVIEEYRTKHTQEISNDIWEMFEFELGKRKYKFNVTDVQINPNIDIITGQIMQIDKSINLYKKFKLNKDSFFSQGLLGKLNGLEFNEIVIRENPDKYNHSNQYKLIIEQIFMNKQNIKKGDRIICYVNIINLPFGMFWEIKKIHKF